MNPDLTAQKRVHFVCKIGCRPEEKMTKVVTGVLRVNILIRNFTDQSLNCLLCAMPRLINHIHVYSNKHPFFYKMCPSSLFSRKR